MSSCNALFRNARLIGLSRISGRKLKIGKTATEMHAGTQSVEILI